jgi:hypothetical protein
MPTRISFVAELGKHPVGDGMGAIDVIDVCLYGQIAEVPLPRWILTQESAVGEVEHAAAGMECVAIRKREQRIAHEAAEVRDESDADLPIRRPTQRWLKPARIPAWRGVMQFKPRRLNTKSRLGAIKLVGLALGSSAIILSFGRHSDHAE